VISRTIFKSLFCTFVIFVYSLPIGILRLRWLRFFHAFSSVVRQMPGYILRKDGARSAFFTH
jgi:hypothetical protein